MAPSTSIRGPILILMANGPSRRPRNISGGLKATLRRILPGGRLGTNNASMCVEK